MQRSIKQMEMDLKYSQLYTDYCKNVMVRQNVEDSLAIATDLNNNLVLNNINKMLKIKELNRQIQQLKQSLNKYAFVTMQMIELQQENVILANINKKHMALSYKTKVSNSCRTENDSKYVCCICLCDETQDNYYRIVGCCKNSMFHTKCIGNWLRRNSTCPLCRGSVRL